MILIYILLLFVCFLGYYVTLKSSSQIAAWAAIHKFTLGSVMKKLSNVRICGLWEKKPLLQWADVWKLSCSFRQTLSCQREHLLTQIVSTPVVGLFLWIKINWFYNVGPTPAKRNLAQTAALSPVTLVQRCAHSTNVSIHMQAWETTGQVTQAVPGTETVCHPFFAIKMTSPSASFVSPLFCHIFKITSIRSCMLSLP